MSDEIASTLPDGTTKTVPAGTTGLDLAASIGRRLAKDAVAAEVDGALTDLTAPLPDHAGVAIVTSATDEGRHVLRHSTAHVLAQAVLQLFPGAKYSIGPAIEDGFYYDFELPGGRDVQRRRPRGRSRPGCARSSPPTSRSCGREMSRRGGAGAVRRPALQARDHRAGRQRARPTPTDAGEVGAGGTISVYRNSPEFVDLCLGPHVPLDGSAGRLQAAQVAGAYWRGDEKRPDAAAHLRHGMGVRQGRSTSTCTAWRRRRSATTAAGHGARPAVVPGRARRRPRRVAPEGRHRAQAHGGLQPCPPRARWLRVRVHAAPGQGHAVRDVGPPRLVRRRRCTRRWRWTTASTTRSR